MRALKIILTVLIVSVSTATKAQDLKALPDNLWNFDKRLRTLKQADTVNFIIADFFLINAWRFSKGGTIDSCDQKPYCEKKRGRRSTGIKCDWVKLGKWTANSDELKISLDKKQITLRTISLTKENIKLVVKSVDGAN
jgi:hypothetical protein